MLGSLRWICAYYCWMNVSAAVVCGEHLRRMKSVLSDPPTDEGGRQISVSLRLLLCDSLVERAWREVGIVPPMIRYPCIRNHVERHQGKSRVYMFAGPGPDSVLLNRFVLFGELDPPRNDAEIKRMILGAEATPNTGRMKKFCQAWCCMLDGFPIRRETLVRFISNSMGGAHHGLKSDTKKKGTKAEEEAALVAFVQNGVVGGPMTGGDFIFEETGVNALYHELYAAAEIMLNEPTIGEQLLECRHVRDGWPPRV